VNGEAIPPSGSVMQFEMAEIALTPQRFYARLLGWDVLHTGTSC